VGYGRGARLIDFMAEDGVVGQYAGSQAREVLITLEEWSARSGTAPLPPDPAPRKLKIQPHAAPAPIVIDEDDLDEDDLDADDEPFDDDTDHDSDDAFADADDEEDPR
jgi:S-DNA-T family DNA segregation ATPase FtsK/SpoIIIE